MRIVLSSDITEGQGGRLAGMDGPSKLTTGSIVGIVLCFMAIKYDLMGLTTNNPGTL